MIVIFGLVVAGIGTSAMALSLAEIAHRFPLAGGQYHFSFILAPPRSARLLGWITGYFAVAGWISLFAANSSLAAQLITGMIALAHPDYSVQPWHIVVIYLLTTAWGTLLNLYGMKFLPTIDKVAIVWSLAGASIITITCLATSSGRYQSSAFVFTGFINETCVCATVYPSNKQPIGTDVQCDDVVSTPLYLSGDGQLGLQSFLDCFKLVLDSLRSMLSHIWQKRYA